MPSRRLAQGEKLWSRGDVAASIVIIEHGRLTIRDNSEFVGIAASGTVLGEGAIFGLEGVAAARTTDVVAMTPATITEFPVEVLKDGFVLGTPKLVLRTLFGQICRNALLVMASQPGHDVPESLLTGVIRALGECEPRFKTIKDWPQFMAAFTTLYHLREASDQWRRQLGKPGQSFDLPRAVEVMKGLLPSPESLDYLKPFLESHH